MAARGLFHLTDPDKIDLTMTLTMSLKEWKIIKGRLRPDTTDADWHLDDTIRRMVGKAELQFPIYENVEKPA